MRESSSVEKEVEEDASSDDSSDPGWATLIWARPCVDPRQRLCVPAERQGVQGAHWARKSRKIAEEGGNPGVEDATSDWSVEREFSGRSVGALLRCTLCTAMSVIGSCKPTLQFQRGYASFFLVAQCMACVTGCGAGRAHAQPNMISCPCARARASF